MTDNNPNAGYSVDPGAVKVIADRLDPEADAVKQQAVKTRNDTFGAAAGGSAYSQAFGPEGAAAAQAADELILNFANALYQIGTTMEEAAGQLRKAGNIYATTDKENMRHLREVGH